MAMRVPMSSQRLLVDEGLVPPHCMSVELLMPANGQIVLRYEVSVTPEHIAKLAAVFQVMASESKSNQDR